MPDNREPQLDDLRRRARRRLVGAVVLALAAAVLVPMLLESDPKPLGEDVSVKIPPIDDSKFVSKVGEKAKAAEPAVPAPKAEPKVEPKVDAPPATALPSTQEPPKEAPKAAATDAPKESAPESGKSIASAEQKVLSPSAKPPAPKAPEAAKAPAAEPVSKAADAPREPAREATKEAAREGAAAKAAAEPAKAAEAPKAGTFSVQLAAFIDDKGANSLAGKLKKSGYPAYTEPYQTTRGTLWRVRVGPYGSRDAAEAARTKLKGEGQNGIITSAARQP
ncbi:MAG TPA: SPOR domain-containing protein [Casimicrobiaceae bacterium]|nr:SPOR domain-containing protein [Casimicrobiaceae bacterium]